MGRQNGDSAEAEMPAAERVAMTIGAESGAATGPIPAEARRQEGLRLERPRASPLDSTNGSEQGLRRRRLGRWHWPFMANSVFRT